MVLHARKVCRNPEACREGCVFCRAVAVYQLSAFELGKRFANMRHRQCFSSRENFVYPCETACVLIDKAVKQRSGQPHAVNAGGVDDGLQAGCGRQLLIWIENAFSAIEQRPPDFQRRGIEAQGSKGKKYSTGVESHEVGIVDQTHDRAMRRDDSLGLAGRTRCEHDIGRRFRRNLSSISNGAGCACIGTVNTIDSMNGQWEALRIA